MNVSVKNVVAVIFMRPIIKVFNLYFVIYCQKFLPRHSRLLLFIC